MRVNCYHAQKKHVYKKKHSRLSLTTFLLHNGDGEIQTPDLLSTSLLCYQLSCPGRISVIFCVLLHVSCKQNGKKHIWTSVWSVQHPNAESNVKTLKKKKTP